MRTRLAALFQILILSALVLACSQPSSPTPAPTLPPTQAPAATKAPAASSTQAAPATKAPAAPTAVAPLSPAVDLKVGVTITLGEAPVYIALEKGYFKEEGLNVEVLPFNSGANMIPPLASGELPIGVGATSAGLFNSIARDVGMRIVAGASTVAPGFSSNYLVARKDLVDSGQLKDYADLKGKTIAISAVGNITQVAVAQALGKAGLTLDDAQIVNMGFPDMITSLANKSVDIAYLPEPFVTNAVDRGIGVGWKPVAEVLPDHTITVWIYSQKLIEQQPEAARRFMAAIVRGARDYTNAFQKNQGRAEIVDILIKHTTVKDRALYDKMAFTWVPPSGEVNVQALQQDIDYYKGQGLLQQVPDLAKAIDTSFTNYAVQRLGPWK